MKSLMKISIGPVQDYIVQAKSTRDMWAGSYMLSWLTASLMKPFYEAGCEFIFPVLYNQPLYSMFADNKASHEALIPTLPNVFMLLVPTNDLSKLVKEAVQSLDNELKHISHACLRKMENMDQSREFPDEWKKRWDYQVKHFFQVNWHSIPYEEPNSWNDSVELLDREMAARRNTRDFEQWGMDGNNVNLSLISGSKDVLSGKEEIIGDVEFWNKLQESGEFRDSGPFGAVNCIKRLFPSVYLENKFHDQKQFWNKMSMINTRDMASRNTAGESEKRDNKGDLIPNKPYFAVLALDGDRMGAAIKKFCNSKEDYRDFSQKLANFSENIVAKTVEKNKGQVIYAGGDDVLALVPADTSLILARELENEFSLIMKDYDLHCSCGIAIAHFKFPLQHVVREARNAESRAKNERKRNAFELSLLKRSGETIQWGGDWDSPALELYHLYTKIADREDSSSQFPYALGRILQPYYRKSQRSLNQLKNIVKLEYQHIRNQQKLQGDESELKKLDTLAFDYVDTVFRKDGKANPEDFHKLFLCSAFMNRSLGDEV